MPPSPDNKAFFRKSPSPQVKIYDQLYFFDSAVPMNTIVKLTIFVSFLQPQFQVCSGLPSSSSTFSYEPLSLVQPLVCIVLCPKHLTWFFLTLCLSVSISGFSNQCNHFLIVSFIIILFIHRNTLDSFIPIFGYFAANFLNHKVWFIAILFRFPFNSVVILITWVVISLKYFPLLTLFDFIFLALAYSILPSWTITFHDKRMTMLICLFTINANRTINVNNNLG